MLRKALPIIFVSVLLGLAFNWFFVDRLPGVSVPIYTALTLGALYYLAWGFRKTQNKSVYWLTPVILFFAVMVFVRANQFLAFMNIVTVIFLLGLVARLAHKPAVRLGQFEIPEYLNVPKNAVVNFARGFMGFWRRLLSERKFSARTESYTPIIRGIILSVPILVVFLLLLSNADMVFSKYLSSIFSFKVSPELISRSLLIGFVASTFIGAFAYVFMPERPESTELAEHKRSLGATEAAIILGSVSALFLTFVMIQLTYLFGGSDHIMSTGFTYAEYARKGFFELIAVAAISLLLVGVVKRLTRFRTQSQLTAFKWLSSILVAEVLIIMFSAHMRLNLYEGAYGFTTLRLYSHLFIIWLAYAFAQLMYNTIRNRPSKNYALQLFVSGLVFFAVINLINPDNFIARRNIERFNSTGKIDVYHLSNLSQDAVPAIAGLLDHPNESIRTDAATILHGMKNYVSAQSHDWQSTNLSRQRAIYLFGAKTDQIESQRSSDVMYRINIQ